MISNKTIKHYTANTTLRIIFHLSNLKPDDTTSYILKNLNNNI